MRACIHCGNTSGFTLVGGPCISCEYDDSDCDDLVAEGKAQAVEETVEAIVVWMRKAFGHTIRKEVLDALERGDWKPK